MDSDQTSKDSNSPDSLKMPEQGGQIDYSNLNAPEPMGGRQKSPPPQGPPLPPPLPPPPAVPSPPSEQALAQEKTTSPLTSFILMGVLGLILIAAILFFLSWKGWLKKTPTPTATPISSPIASPSITTSPEVVVNINDQTKKTDLETIQKALNKYFQDKESYPISASFSKTSDSGSPLALALVPAYSDKLPDDPLAPAYYYGYKSDGEIYELTAVLEDKSDSLGTQVGNYYLYILTNK